MCISRRWGDGTEPPAPILLDGQEELEVKKIVAQCGTGQRCRYRVRWHVYTIVDDPWLTESELSHAPDILYIWQQS